MAEKCQFIMNKRNVSYFVASNVFYSSVALALQHISFCNGYRPQSSYVQLFVIRFTGFETELVRSERCLGCLAIHFSKVAAQTFKVTLQSAQQLTESKALTAKHHLAPTPSRASTTNDPRVSLLHNVKDFSSHYTFSYLYIWAHQDTFVNFITSIGMYLCMYAQHLFYSRVFFRKQLFF